MMQGFYKMLLLSGVLGLTACGTSEISVNPIPAFSLPELGKPTHSIGNADFPKKPFLLTTWASWCGACREENPYLTTLSQQGIRFVGLNVQDEAEDATDFLKQHGNPFMFTIQDEDGDFTKKLDIPVLPYTLLVDGKGAIRQRIEGELDEEAMVDRVQPCLTALQNNATDTEIKKACQ